MEQRQFLKYEDQGRKPVAKRQEAKLGQCLDGVMKRNIEPRYRECGAVVDAFIEMIPQALAEHCRIAGVEKGVITITADLPCYLHELRICSDELLRHIRQRSPQVRIKRIRCRLES